MKLAFGTTLQWNAQPVALLTSINGPEISVDSVDVTSHDSDDYYKESLPGLLDGGEVTLEGGFDYTDTAGQHTMLSDMNNRTTREAIITFPSATGATWTFNAYVTRLKIGDAPIDGVISFSASIKIVGKPEFAVATSTGLTTPWFVISESAVVTPDEAGDAYEYVATVATGITSVTCTPTAAAGVITVNGNVVATGVASSAITLGAAGTNTTITVIVTESAKAPLTYTILVARAAAP